jgi:hypothetical protein
VDFILHRHEDVKTIAKVFIGDKNDSSSDKAG